MSLDTLRGEQDALGAHRARRRHRHHVDRRHDVAHPRLRQVAARFDQPARPEHHHGAEVGRPQLRLAARASSRSRAGRTSRWRMRARSSATARRSRSSTSGSARWATAQSRIYLRSREDEAAGDHRRDRELVGRELREAGIRALVHPRRSRAPPQVVVLGNTPGSRCSPTSIRSARRCGSARTRSPSSACSASVRAPGASRPARTTSRSFPTARTRSCSARC